MSSPRHCHINILIRYTDNAMLNRHYSKLTTFLQLLANHHKRLVVVFSDLSQWLNWPCFAYDSEVLRNFLFKTIKSVQIKYTHNVYEIMFIHEQRVSGRVLFDVLEEVPVRYSELLITIRKLRVVIQ